MGNCVVAPKNKHSPSSITPSHPQKNVIDNKQPQTMIVV